MNRVIQVICVLVTAGCIFSSAQLSPIIKEQRQELQLKFQPIEGQDMPVWVAVGNTALGAFKGVLINIAWYRANGLQQAGKYFEANQQAQWITTLQPHYADAWVFLGWNMAYNISVATHTPAERWDWVRKGIRLVQDKGIFYNQLDVEMYKELAWWYQHKIGQFSDDMHWYYKSMLAREWQIVLGNESQGASEEQAINIFKRVVDAPNTILQLVATNPAAATVIEHLEEMGHPADRELLRQIGTLLMYHSAGDVRFNSRQRIDQVICKPGTDEAIDINLIPVILDNANQEALDAVLNTLRKIELIDHYHMDPDYMLSIMKGTAWDKEDPLPLPVDWRHPHAHALYWALLGVEKSIYKLEKKNVDKLNTYRRNIHAVQFLMYWGYMDYDPWKPNVFNQLVIRPDPRFIEAYNQAYYKGVEYIKSDEKLHGPTEANFELGHENFLVQAVLFHFLYGNEEDSRRYYMKLRELYGEKPQADYRGSYDIALQDFVIREIPSLLQQGVGPTQYIDAMLHVAFKKGLGTGEMKIYRKFREIAEKQHKAVQEKAFINANVTKGARQLPPFDELEAKLFIIYMRMQPKRGDDLNLRTRMWYNADNDRLKLPAYDRIIRRLTFRCRFEGLDPAKAFPPPEGIDTYRSEQLKNLTPEGDLTPGRAERQ